MQIFKPSLIIIYGATGVGKTDFALELARQIPAEIINMDMGQFYTPLTIGTAKPDWRSYKTPHHLFDIIDKPENFSVTKYRELVLNKVKEVWGRNKLAILIGGSGFYLKSLFFPPNAATFIPGSFEHLDNDQLWHMLHEVDPLRAANIHVHDRYRLLRAVQIWHSTGKKPSDHLLNFCPPRPFILINLMRDREQLYQRINQRTNQMLDMGWVEEVEQLQNTLWVSFLQSKKIIGYDDILSYLAENKNQRDKERLIETISQKTRNYAKRQMTFWRMLERQLEKALAAHDDLVIAKSELITFNLTLSDLDLYINQLMQKLKQM